MGIERLDMLFHPRSVAVVGASERPGSMGRAVMRNLIEAGFAGAIYPVNPRWTSIMQRRAVPDLLQVPGPVDLVVVATPLARAAMIVAQCGRIQAAGAVILSAGGRGTGAAGRRLEAEIRDAAGPAGVRIVGPDGLGIICSAARLNASPTARMPQEGRLAFVSQSGALGAAILDGAAREHIGFSHCISLGAMLDVNFGDVIDYLGGDPKVGSIVMYMESLVDPRRFMSAARAVSRIKPIIVLKAGRSRAEAAAAASPTGAMAGEDAVFDAAFQRAGIVRVKTFEELFDAAEILSRKSRFRGPSLAIVTNAGGPGVMAADALADYAMAPVALPPETVAALDGILPPHWSRANPVDILGDASPDRYQATVSTLLQAKAIDALLVMLTPQAMTDATAVAEILANRFQDSDKPVIAAWLGGCDVERGRQILDQAGIPTFDTPERAVRAFMNRCRHARGIEMLQQIPPRLSTRIQVDRPAAARLIDDALGGGAGLMPESAARALAAAYGIPMHPTAVADAADAAAAIAGSFGTPVTMKLLSPQISHGSDVGGVLTGIDGAEAVRRAFDRLVARAAAAAPQASFEGIAIQPMIDPAALELNVGTRRDPLFGPVIRFGSGSIGTERFGDYGIALPPLNRLLAARLMQSTRVNQLLDGYQGRPAADREALEAILIRLSQLVTDFPQIAELDIHPLMVAGARPVAVDVRVRLAANAGPAPLHLVISPYPAQYESHIHIDGVGELLVRPVRPEDADLLVDLFNSLSPRSIYYRFFSPMKQLSPEMLARFTQIDYDREIALVAIRETGSEEKMFGAARVILQPNLKDAEFAVLIGDPWQGRGIGAHLLSRCIDIARERKLGTIWGTVLAENKGMLALGRKLGFAITRSAQSGEFELQLEIDDTATERREHVA